MDCDVRVKLRNYKLDCDFHEFGSKTKNQKGLKKESSGQILNLIIDRDIYIVLDLVKDIEGVILSRKGQIIQEGIILDMEQEITRLLATGIKNGEVGFEPDIAPNLSRYKNNDMFLPVTAGMAGKISKDPYFEYY